MTYCQDCKKQANYNIVGNKPKYCKTHKTIEMVDVIHPRCIHKVLLLIR